MSELFPEISTQLDLVKSLGKYEIELGILQNNQFLTVAVKHASGEKIEYRVPVEDIAYVIEYGTVQMPGTHILQYLDYWLDIQLTQRLNKILDGIFEREWTEDDIRIEMSNFEIAVNNFIQSYISAQIKEMTFLADKTGQKGLVDFPVDVSVLRSYIQCRISKKV